MKYQSILIKAGIFIGLVSSIVAIVFYVNLPKVTIDLKTTSLALLGAGIGLVLSLLLVRNIKIKLIKRPLTPVMAEWTNSDLNLLGAIKSVVEKNESDLETTLKIVLSIISNYMGALECVFYLQKEDKLEVFVVESTIENRLKERELVTKEFERHFANELREIKERPTIVTSDVPDRYRKIISGVNESPQTIVICPIHVHGNVIAVIEVSLRKAFGNIERSFLEHVRLILAPAVELYNIRKKRELTLLEEVEGQNEEMQRVGEEMQRMEKELSDRLSTLMKLHREIKEMEIPEQEKKLTASRVKFLVETLKKLEKIGYKKF